VDVILVVAVLRLNQGSSGATPSTVTRVTDRSPSPSGSASSEPSPSASTTSSPSPGITSPPAESTPSPDPDAADDADAAVPVKRLLVAVDDRRAWRVTTGTCDGGGSRVSVTVDGGATWDTRPAPLASIDRLVVRPGSNAVFAVGAGDDCAVKLRRTTDRGVTWRGAGGLDGFFYIDPRDAGSVVVPGRGSVEACAGRPVLDIAVDGRDLEVLCPGGTLRSIGDGDSSWTEGPTVPGAVAVASSSTGAARTYVARIGRGDCDGVQIVDVEKTADPVSCVRRADPVTPGSVSLGVAGSAGWLLVGGDVYRSHDSLDRWVER
jgi:hypothetical protein